jgi:hypothetical protein
MSSEFACPRKAVGMAPDIDVRNELTTQDTNSMLNNWADTLVCRRGLLSRSVSVVAPGVGWHPARLRRRIQNSNSTLTGAAGVSRLRINLVGFFLGLFQDLFRAC